MSSRPSGTSIGNDGKVMVTVGKADMGQHIASTMAQLVAEELEASWKDMSVVLASNDPKYNDPVLGAQITGGSWSTRMNFDAMSRAGAAGRHDADHGRRRDDGRAGERVSCPRIARPSRQIRSKSRDLRRDRQERQGQQDLDAGRAQGDQAEDAGPVHQDRPFAAAARHSGEDQRHLQYGIDAMFRACSTASSRCRRCAMARR